MVVAWGIILCPILALAQQTAPSTPSQSTLSFADALSLARQQVSALQQAEIDQRIAAEDVRQAEAALLPRARDAFSIAYNSRISGTDAPSFIAQNAIHEYQNLLGVTGDWNFGLFAAVRRSRALLDAPRPKNSSAAQA